MSKHHGTKTSVTVSGKPPIHADNNLPFDTAVERTIAAGYTAVHSDGQVWQGWKYLDGQEFLVTHTRGNK